MGFPVVGTGVDPVTSRLSGAMRALSRGQAASEFRQSTSSAWPEVPNSTAIVDRQIPLFSVRCGTDVSRSPALLGGSGPPALLAPGSCKNSTHDDTARHRGCSLRPHGGL